MNNPWPEYTDCFYGEFRSCMQAGKYTRATAWIPHAPHPMHDVMWRQWWLEADFMEVAPNVIVTKPDYTTTDIVTALGEGGSYKFNLNETPEELYVSTDRPRWRNELPLVVADPFLSHMIKCLHQAHGANDPHAKLIEQIAQDIRAAPKNGVELVKRYGPELRALNKAFYALALTKKEGSADRVLVNLKNDAVCFVHNALDKYSQPYSLCGSTVTNFLSFLQRFKELPDAPVELSLHTEEVMAKPLNERYEITMKMMDHMWIAGQLDVARKDWR